MDMHDFLKQLDLSTSFKQVENWLKSNKKHVIVKDFVGSADALYLHQAQQNAGKKAVYVLEDEDAAGYLYNDLLTLSSDTETYFFPSSFKKKFRHGIKKDEANMVLRTECLNALSSDEATTVVTYADALFEKTISPKLLDKETLTLSVGQEVDMDFVVEMLLSFSFTKVDFVYEAGQFSQRGSIIDVFSYSDSYPYRIDFSFTSIKTIRRFNIEDQLSLDDEEKISIVSNAIHNEKDELVSVFDFFDKDTVFFLFNSDIIVNQVIEDKSELFISKDEYIEHLKAYQSALVGNHHLFTCRESIRFDQSVQPLFHKNFELTAKDFKEKAAMGYQVYVFSDNVKQIERLKDIFEDKDIDAPFQAVMNQIHEGFIDHEIKVAAYTDHQIFDRFHKYALKSNKTRSYKALLSIKELMQFQVGDYVVHADHGVGRFGGLIRTEVNGKMQEVIKLTFQGDDIIFVNIHSLHRISKYKSKDGEPPKLNKLGTAAWSNLKEKTKKKVKDIARELIQLYAQRRKEEGFAFSADSYLQQELESSFIYEDTPDQLKATKEVKKDMEEKKPMDRLICGDVGFGKTEVAIRAAFKAACDGKQVAVLVPTTVLAFQHYKSFSRRLKRLPCRVDYISRARKASEIKEIKEDLKKGKIDILIGTHKILGKDIEFKDLGLLIIDEEQKFGVSAKEKLKTKRVSVDTLTMTATPIPRTLQFSLMGARDLSIISTPPPNRHPVQTELIAFDDDVIKEAIEYEIARGGQIFFVNNRIASLADIEIKLHSLVPKAKIAVGHGQMESDKMEELILEFMNHEYDILLSTSIIESGIDIPNVNTMFIMNAQNFGLSDLHQLRGRVGRTNKKAFCYLITPPLSALPTDSRRRLEAIENFSDLGSGIHIAMQDLDIRGAGNVLGGEQSGFIADLGYETYHKILDEAVYELKHNDFAELFQDEINAEKYRFTTDCSFESDLELLLPATYVESVSERMQLYKRLDAIKSDDELEKFEKELEDRFGALPSKAKELLFVVRLRNIGMQLGIEKLMLKNNKLYAYFISDFSSPYYRSEVFNRILVFVTEKYKLCQFKEQKGKRYLVITPISTVKEAFTLISKI